MSREHVACVMGHTFFLNYCNKKNSPLGPNMYHVGCNFGFLRTWDRAPARATSASLCLLRSFAFLRPLFLHFLFFAFDSSVYFINLPHGCISTKSGLYLTHKKGCLHLDPGQLPLYCLLYTSPSPRDATLSRMPSSA